MVHFSGTVTTKVEKSKPSLEEDKSKSVLHSFAYLHKFKTTFLMDIAKHILTGLL